MTVITAGGLLVMGTVLLLFSLAVGLIVAVGAPFILWTAVTRIKKAVGEVAEIGEGRGPLGTWVRVIYLTPEGQFETHAYSRHPRHGERITVRYPPGKPAKGTTALSARSALFIGGGTLAAVIYITLALGMIASAFWRFGGSHTRLQVPVGCGSVGLALGLASSAAAVRQYVQLLQYRRLTSAEAIITPSRERLPDTAGEPDAQTSADTTRPSLKQVRVTAIFALFCWGLVVLAITLL